MSRQIARLQLNRESVRRLTAAPRGAMSALTDTFGPCRSISYCDLCVTYDAACVEETRYCTA